jgi:hypothetical protein
MPKFKIALVTLIMMLPILPASAASWICGNGEILREISIKRETTNAAPCSVIYDKDIEGAGIKVLWSAQNDGSYCDAKADGLAEKLSGLGWACTEI